MSEKNERKGEKGRKKEREREKQPGRERRGTRERERETERYLNMKDFLKETDSEINKQSPGGMKEKDKKERSRQVALEKDTREEGKRTGVVHVKSLAVL